MSLDRMLTRLALLSIRGYQRYLSPIKGFSCALRVATGGASCSAYGYRAIQRRGVRRGLPLLRRRLAACGDIHRQNVAVRNLSLRNQGGFCDLPCDSPGCDLPGCDLPSGKSLGRACSFIGDFLSCCDFGWDSKKKKEGRERHRSEG
jgi:putative component of membrane protein insertase Oxa1/YidC/SpoIIIJ protein YidD